MRIGVISAFGKESKPLRSRLKEIGREEMNDHLCFVLRYGQEEVIVLRSGSGKERGRKATELLINRFYPQLIINCGTAGAISPHRRIGDVIISEHVIEYEANDDQLFKEATYQSDPDLVTTSRQVTVESLPKEKIVAGIILSGTPVINSKKRKDELWNQFHGQCVEQEGAGVAKVCQEHNIPWIVIRGISDQADEHARKEFKKNIDYASQNAALVTFEFMKMLFNDPLTLINRVRYSKRN